MVSFYSWVDNVTSMKGNYNWQVKTVIIFLKTVLRLARACIRVSIYDDIQEGFLSSNVASN